MQQTRRVLAALEKQILTPRDAERVSAEQKKDTSNRRMQLTRKQLPQSTDQHTESRLLNTCTGNSKN